MTPSPAKSRVLTIFARWYRGGTQWTSGTTPWTRPTRRGAVRTVLAFLGIYLVLHFGVWLWLDYGPPRLRDPEYGKRLKRAEDRSAENPNRPVVLVIGSSRTSMGVRPGVLADVCRVLADEAISISSVIQHEAVEGHPDQAVPLVIMTHYAATGKFRAAIERINFLPAMAGDVVYYSVDD